MIISTIAIMQDDALLSEMADTMGIEVTELPESFTDPRPPVGIIRRVSWLRTLVNGDEEQAPLTHQAVQEAEMFQAEFLLVFSEKQKDASV